MDETGVVSQVQVLHMLVQDNYNKAWLNVMPDAKHRDGEDWKAVAKMQIHLSAVFPSNKEGRTRRLETLAAILPLLSSTGKPLEFASSNILTLAEVYALLSWLDENGKAAQSLRIIAKDPHGWAVKLREYLGYLERPSQEVDYAETQQPEDLGPIWSSVEGPHERQREEELAPF